MVHLVRRKLVLADTDPAEGVASDNLEGAEDVDKDRLHGAVGSLRAARAHHTAESAQAAGIKPDRHAVVA